MRALPKRCPHHKLKLENGECPECGWKPPLTEQGSGKSEHARDAQCIFRSGPHRCPLPATWYPENAPIGQHQHYNRRGFCAMHDREEKRDMEPWEAQAQIKRFQEHARIIYDELREDSWKHERERMIQQKINEHPEWQRGEDETSSAYQRRMLGIAKQLGKGVRARYRHE